MRHDKQRLKQEQEVRVELKYKCLDCGKEKLEDYRGMICTYCGGDLRGSGISISGTRDSFGIGKSFKDDETGKEIDNWRSWEKAGFRDAIGATRDKDMKEKIKEKIEKKSDKNKTVVTV